MTDTTAPDVAPEVQGALDEFDVAEYLSDAINVEDSITVYKDGPTLNQLARASRIAADAVEKQEISEKAQLSIADDFDEAATEAVAVAKALREKLQASGITFQLRSIGTESREVLLNKLAREKRFKAQPATDDEPAVPGGRQHPDFMPAFEEELIAKAIVSANAGGKTDSKQWTVARVKKLRGLPGNEFQRLWNKCYDIHFMQYDIEKMIDLDF